MQQTIAPKPDHAVAAKPVPTVWVLVQTAPRFAVLAVSDNRRRMLGEMADLYAAHRAAGRTAGLGLAVQPANLLPG